MKNTLSQQYILANTHPFYHTVAVADSVSSTNDVVKAMAPHRRQGYVLVADSQQAGKGRNGKTFYSPAGKGLYLSVLLKPQMDFSNALLVTAAAAVAAAQAIEATADVSCGIKWVNDIYINNRKIAGILAETALQPGSSQLDYMVLGIGINTHTAPFPPELENMASAVRDFATPPDRNALACRFLNRFYDYYSNLEAGKFMDYYRAKSILMGKNISVYHNNTAYTATVTGIDDMGRLVVRTSSSTETVLSSGEITVREAAL